MAYTARQGDMPDMKTMNGIIVNVIHNGEKFEVYDIFGFF